MYTLRFHFVDGTSYDAKISSDTKEKLLDIAKYYVETQEAFEANNDVINIKNVTMIQVVKREK